MVSNHILIRSSTVVVEDVGICLGGRMIYLLQIPS